MASGDLYPLLPNVSSSGYQVESRSHPAGETGVRSSLDEVARRATAGMRHVRVIAWARNQVSAARDRGSSANSTAERARILLLAVQKKLWIPDPIGTEFIAGAHHMLCDDPKELCFAGADCFPQGTLVLAEGHEPTAIENIKPGMRIWGLDSWVRVEAQVYKGLLEVDRIYLNNGSSFEVTPDHHVNILVCEKHEGSAGVPKYGCSCRPEERTPRKIQVRDLQPYMVLPTPTRIAFGTERLDPDQALVEGFYIADGWCSKNSSFEISGCDGFPKEAQKQEVQDICDNLGIETRWARKYISVKDPEWTMRVHGMGQHAPDKHFLTINLDEGAAGPSLRGVMADSGANAKNHGRTFTSTSKQLALQVRLLHKMFGVSCSTRYIENHGGLGKNPIYRVANRESSNKADKLLRVKEIDRNVATVPCYDIQTEDHNVYLPEADVTVLNCDELVVLLASATSAVGIPTLIVGHSYEDDRNISHVLCKLYDGKKWLYADPSTDLPLGTSHPYTRERYIAIPSGKVVCDAKSCETDQIPGDVVEPLIGTFIGVSGVSPVRWLGAECGDDLSCYTKFVNSDGSIDWKGVSEDVGALAAAAICTVATEGVGAVIAPACAVAGSYLGQAIYAVGEAVSKEINKLFGAQSNFVAQSPDRTKAAVFAAMVAAPNLDFPKFFLRIYGIRALSVATYSCATKVAQAASEAFGGKLDAAFVDLMLVRMQQNAPGWKPLLDGVGAHIFWEKHEDNGTIDMSAYTTGAQFFGKPEDLTIFDIPQVRTVTDKSVCEFLVAYTDVVKLDSVGCDSIANVDRLVQSMLQDASRRAESNQETAELRMYSPFDMNATFLQYNDQQWDGYKAGYLLALQGATAKTLADIQAQMKKDPSKVAPPPASPVVPLSIKSNIVNISAGGRGSSGASGLVVVGALGAAAGLAYLLLGAAK